MTQGIDHAALGDLHIRLEHLYGQIGRHFVNSLGGDPGGISIRCATDIAREVHEVREQIDALLHPARARS